MPDVHCKLSPSGAKRWLSCPGSLSFAGSETTSIYAAEGTVAHTIASKCWLLGVQAESFLGRMFNQDGFDFVVTEEMVNAVQLYLDTIDGLGGGFGLVENYVEHSTIEGFGGTVDYYYEDSLGKVFIADLKYGAGVPVEVEENEQLACYALLGLDKFNSGWYADVTLTIVQPRTEHRDGPVRSWVASADYLKDLQRRIVDVADGKRSSEIHAGDHCRWCPAKATCPELYQLTTVTAQNEFAEPQMTPELASKVLSKADAIRSYLAAVEEWAHGQLDKGVVVPGYKLVNSFGPRRFREDDATVTKKLARKGFGKRLTHKSVLLSPTQLEKVAGKDVLAPMVERPHLGTTVVPESDRREAVKRLTAADEFAEPYERLGDLF